MFFSVCIAVYNAENYLEESLNSVLNQSFKDFDVWLIDDCSTDGSGDICDNLAGKYSDKVNVVHHTENQGLLLARRTFFNNAKGEWFVAVDADDLLEQDALLKLYNKITQTGCDLLLYDLTCIHPNGEKEQFTVDLKENYVYTGDEKSEVYNQIFLSTYINSMCTKAIHRSIIDWNIDYESWKDLRFGTDIFQSLPIFDAANKTVYLKESLYKYIKRDNAITTKWHKNWYDITKMLYERKKHYRNKWNLSKEINTKSEISYLKTIVSYLDAQFSKSKKYGDMVKYFKTINYDGNLKECYNYIKGNKIKKRYKIYAECIIHKFYFPLYMVIMTVNLLQKCRVGKKG